MVSDEFAQDWGRLGLIEDRTHIAPMNRALRKSFWEILRFSGKRPRQGLYVLQTIYRQGQAVRRRRQWLDKGIHVPPYLIASVTERCNLQCKGCYAQAHIRPESAKEEMSLDCWSEILGEAQTLGISVVILAGGEPLARQGLLDLVQTYPRMIFLLFTNGLLVDTDVLSRLKSMRNVIPIVSMEGPALETDARRGVGVYDRVGQVLRRFDRSGLFYGVSITVTRENMSKVTDQAFIKSLTVNGCQLYFFIEYVPIKEGTDELVLSDSQQIELDLVTQRLNKQFGGLFISFPGDEKLYGGCLAAGRGFVHINSVGGMEPCPFAPFSDVNLKNVSLQEALRSKFLRSIREEHGKLTETKGGCALWAHRDWVRETLEKTSH